MCLIAWNWQPESILPLVLLSNRDEFYQRPAMPLHWWPPDENGSRVLAGRDLQAGGTWLGVTATGRLAALTNYRTTAPLRMNAPSRGALVADFLLGSVAATDYLQALSTQAHQYNPFNLLVFDGRNLLGLESRGARIVHMAPGVGAVSNADFHTPWPKVRLLTAGFRAATDTQPSSLLVQRTSSLVALLHDRNLAMDSDLPATGIALDLERALSAVFIATPFYGTRASSVVSIGRKGVEFVEESWGAEGLSSTHTERFRL
jgi:uncharacterized protein with NRDE domain